MLVTECNLFEMNLT